MGGIEQEDLIGELRRRFPLIERLVGRFGSKTYQERVPWFFALILAAATKRDPGACCFVLEKTRGTTAVAAVLLALAKFQDEFPELVRRYAHTTLHRGQRVRVKPSDYVYEYSGVREGNPDLFRLKVLGTKDYRSFRKEDVLRLEPTDRLRPKGQLRSPLGDFERSAIDKLLDLTTCGNNSLIRNTVLLFMAQARFAEVVDAIDLAPEHNTGFDHLAGFLPWGSIGPHGELRPNDAYQVAGEPIVAVTRVPEDLALASSSAPVATKAVLVDGARSLTRDLQAFDDVADRQRVVILASSEETEALELLRDRDCPIWYMSPSEILIGEASVSHRTRASLVGASIRAAKTRQRVKVTVVDCQNNALQVVAASLERAAEQIRDSEEAHESEGVLVRLFGLLFDCSECCFGISKATEDNLRVIQDRLTQLAIWLDPEVARELQDASSQLEKIIASGTFGQGKAEALLKFAANEDLAQWAMIARSPRTAASLREGLHDWGVTMPVFPVSAIASDRDYAGIIVPAWLNSQRFARLKSQAVTDDIRILAYPFETKWISRYQVRERTQERSNRIEAETRSSILGIEPHLLDPLKAHEPEPSIHEIDLDLPIFKVEERMARRRVARPVAVTDGEDSREAQLVQFFGDCHAWLTEWAELPKLNQLIDGVNENETRITSVTVSKLVPGDFVLFRTSGDKEFIRLIAEEILGAAEYERIRTIAERWKTSLRCFGTSPADLQRRLAAHGLHRTLATIGGWLGSPDRIGPSAFRDIELIAKATGDTELLSMRKGVEKAISRIRGAHISAGNRLTQLLLSNLSGRLNRLDEQPMLLALDYGEAWVVQVELIEERRQACPLNSVNRLLWTDDMAF